MYLVEILAVVSACSDQFYMCSASVKGKPRRKKLKHLGPPCVFPPNEVEETSLRAWKISNIGKAVLQRYLQNSDGRVGCKCLRIHNPSGFDRWVLIYLPMASPEQLPVLREKFNVHQPVVVGEENGGHSVMAEVWRLMPSKSRRRAEFQKQKGQLKEMEGKTTNYKCTLESLCVPKEDLQRLGFPKTGVRLDQIEGSNEGYAIDCEMCLSGTSRVLTRVVVIRFSDGEVLLDKLVKPDVPITDYVTQFSGITEEALADVTYRLADAQQWLRENIGRTDILIGHSLDSDLNALEIQFDRVVDTTVLFPHVRGLPFRSSLKYLAEKFLDWAIQNPEKIGHNPVEDAKACELLVRLVLINGPAFGDEILRLKPFSTFLSESSAKATIVGPRIPVFDSYGTADHVVCAEPQQCVEATLKAADKSQAICCTLENNPNLNSQVAYLMDHLPAATMVTLIVGTGEVHKAELQKLHDKRSNYRKMYREQKWDEIENPWTVEDDNKLKEVSSLSRCCDLFATSIVDPNELQNLPSDIRESFDRSWDEEGLREKSPKMQKLHNGEAQNT